MDDPTPTDGEHVSRTPLPRTPGTVIRAIIDDEAVLLGRTDILGLGWVRLDGGLSGDSYGNDDIDQWELFTPAPVVSAKVIQDFIEGLRAEFRLYPDIYAEKLAEALTQDIEQRAYSTSTL